MDITFVASNFSNFLVCCLILGNLLNLRDNCMLRQQSKRLIGFAKKNSGPLIIGLSLIIALNFSRFTDYAAEVHHEIHLAIYQLSGQAEADEAEYRREVAQRAQKWKDMDAEQADWQMFLASARRKFSQIALVKNSYGGDYLCLQVSHAEEVSAYQVRDSIADDFVQWLNGQSKLYDEWAPYEVHQSKTVGPSPGSPFNRHWTYKDLATFADQPYVACSSAKDLWRANRYQERID
jgi:hypothetical protein